jgi:adenine/guanine/hypoxanthine permease
VLGGGAILGGLVLGAIAVFVIEREFVKAAAFSLAGAALTFFGFMHGEAIGIAQTPLVACAYLGVAIVLMTCSRAAAMERAPLHADGAPHGAVAAATPD